MGDSKVIAAIVGVMAAVLASLITGWINYRRLRAELISQHRNELIRRQIDACEALWRCLEATSFSDVGASPRIVTGILCDPKISVAEIEKFIAKINEVFHSSNGLYFSKRLRKRLFNFRENLTTKYLNTKGDEPSEIGLSRAELGEFQKMVSDLRNEIRTDLGVEDLNLASKGPI